VSRLAATRFLGYLRARSPGGPGWWAPCSGTSPTKRDLLVAIFKELLARLDAEARQLAADDPATGLFRFFRTVIDEAAAGTTVLALLRPTDDVRTGHALASLQEQIAELLRRGQQAGSVRPDLGIAEVIALLTSVTEGALAGGWDVPLRD
jgi:AcrR family transcriptional regulator